MDIEAMINRMAVDARWDLAQLADKMRDGIGKQPEPEKRLGLPAPQPETNDLLLKYFMDSKNQMENGNYWLARQQAMAYNQTAIGNPLSLMLGARLPFTY